jgi:hypothetical protein
MALSLEGDVARDAIRSAGLDHSLVFTVCYCSVFDDCWIVSHGGAPRSVARCQADEVESWVGFRHEELEEIRKELGSKDARATAP